MEAPNAPNPETQMLREIKIKIKYLQAQPQLQVLQSQYHNQLLLVSYLFLKFSIKIG